MRTPTLNACAALLLAAAATQAAAGKVDAKLLDMLLANGAITQAQHAELTADLKAEQAAEQSVASSKPAAQAPSSFEQLAGWAGSTKFYGDMRVRQDQINIDGEHKYGGRDQDRQRLRARLGLLSQINPEVDVGIQIASGSSADRRSTNQTMTDYFDKKQLWLDLAYIDYHPTSVPGLRLVGGKMKQQWMSVGDAIWDGDINPEGFAAQHKVKVGAATLFGSIGYYDLKDNVDGEGVEWEHDLAMYQGQAGVMFGIGADSQMTLGVSMYDFNKDKYGSTSSFRTNGNTTDAFGIGEVFGQLDLKGMPVPLTIYGQYAQNYEARDFAGFEDGNEDTAWLLGLKTTVAGISLDYNYRDVERNAVVGGFTDSDFGAGYAGASGHKLKVAYDFIKNLNGSVTWMPAESDTASRSGDNADVSVWMFDIVAKF